MIKDETSPTRVRWCIAIWLCMACITFHSEAANRYWNGGAGGDGGWANSANWGGSVPVSGDSLFFGGVNTLLTTNNLPSTNIYSGLTFQAGSGGFVLRGNSLILSGNITNYSTVFQTNNLDIVAGNLIVLVTNSCTLYLNGVVSSTNGSLTKLGRGTLVLNALNTYPGGTVISRGTIKVTANGRLGAPGGPLTLDGGAIEIGNILTFNNRPVTLSTNGGTFSLDQISFLTVTNSISGPGGLTKSGEGALILAGPVASTGPVNANGGILYVDSAMSGPVSVNVNSGGMLGGSGTIWGDITVADGGTLSPGTNDVRGPATLTVSNLVLNPNSILRMDLNAPGSAGGTNDLLQVRGNLVLNGILKATGNGASGIYPIIQYYGSMTNLGLIPGPSVSGSLVFDSANKVVNLNAISFPSAPPTPMRVFYIGNSLTYTFNIPDIVQKLAGAAGDWLAYSSDLIGGSTLVDHWNITNTVNLIDSGIFDLVMLQEYSMRPSIPTDRTNYMYPAARSFNEHITAHGEKTIFYQTWGYPYGDPAHCAQYDIPPEYRGCGSTNMLIATRKGYSGIANELSAAISPVGLAWLIVQTERPDINLYNNTTGDYHPGSAGAYLAACVHYASFFGRSPVGNPALGSLTDPTLAAYLQGIADRVVFGDPWALDPWGFGPNRFYWAQKWMQYTNQSYSRLQGVVISGNGGLASPSLLLDINAGVTNTLYLGTYGYKYETAGHGRLFIRPGGSLEITSLMVVGKEGQGHVRHDGGTLQVAGTLRIAEQPSSSGSYTLSNGLLSASAIEAGQGNAVFTMTGGQLSFSRFGNHAAPLSLEPSGGIVAPSNAAIVIGNFNSGTNATMSFVLGGAGNSLTVSNGTASLAGTLVLRRAPGYTPAVGQQFTILTAPQVQGKFDRIVNSVNPTNQIVFAPNYFANSVVVRAIDIRGDSNTNGLADGWELTYFGSLDSGQNWTNSFLGDGIPNGLKFALYADPTQSFPVEKRPRAGIFNTNLTITYRQHTGGTGRIGIDYTADGMLYRVDLGDTLTNANWRWGTNWVEWTGARLDNGDGSETVTVRSRRPISGSSQGLLRLGVIR